MAYTIRIEQPLPDLMVLDLRPDGELVVGETGKVTGELRNEFKEIAQPFHVVFRVDGSTITDTVVSGIGIEEELTLTAQVSFSKGGTHEVEMEVDSQDEVVELAETNNSQLLIVEILSGPGGQLVVRPNPFTPNGDGYNDEVVFQVAGMALTDPVVKIFDRGGIEVREIRGSSQWLMWDGRNDSGREMEPGVYLYLLIDGNKKLNSGTVVLAR